jgi:hypothetical protein
MSISIPASFSRQSERRRSCPSKRVRVENVKKSATSEIEARKAGEQEERNG